MPTHNSTHIIIIIAPMRFRPTALRNCPHAVTILEALDALPE